MFGGISLCNSQRIKKAKRDIPNIYKTKNKYKVGALHATQSQELTYRDNHYPERKNKTTITHAQTQMEKSKKLKLKEIIINKVPDKQVYEN